jgi:uncharacterized protein YciI
MKQWIYVLHPPRPTFIQDATENEPAAMGEHFEYLKDLLAQGTSFLAGPCLDAPFGIAAFDAANEDEARDVMAADPAIRSGVMTADLHAFRVSLFLGRAG